MKLDDKLEIVVKVKGKIDFKKDEIEAMLVSLEEYYGSLVIQENDVDRAKKERADLNKYTKLLSKFRKEKMSEATEWLTPFETFMKGAESRSKAVSKLIDEQVKEFEEKVKDERREKVGYLLEKVYDQDPKYMEFSDYFDLDETIYTSPQSFTSKGLINKKLSDHIQSKFDQIDEILKARATEQKMIDDKKKIIVQACAQYSEMMELKTPIDPEGYGHLVGLELSEITETLVRVAKKQKLIEETAKIETVEVVEEVTKVKKKKTAKKDFNITLKQLNKAQYKKLVVFLKENGYNFSSKEI